MRWRTQAGFSLIELIVVVAVSGIVMAMLTVGIRTASEGFAIRRATSITVAELRRAQAAAMATGADVTLELYSSSGSGTAGGVKMWAGGSEARRVLTPEWPEQVQIQDGPSNFPACTAPADTAHQCAVFRPLGDPVASGRVRLRYIGGTGVSLEVAVDPATGRVSVQR